MQDKRRDFDDRDFTDHVGAQCASLAGLWREAAEQAEASEAARALSPVLAGALAAADYFSLYVPHAIGGPELSPLEANARLFHLARHDAASAWVSMIGSTASLGAAYMDRKTAADIFIGEGRITCGIFAPNGTARKDGDDFLVSGRWAWASGSANADYIGLGCRVIDADHAAEKSKTPETRLVMVPMAALVKHDNWHTIGLCGSSSGDVEAHDIRVPQAHGFSVREGHDWPETPLYKMPYFGLLASGIGAVALGNSRAALDDFYDMAAHKTPMGTTRPLAQRGGVQTALAQAEAEWQAAFAYYGQVLQTTWRAAQAAQAAQAGRAGEAAGLAPTQKADLRLMATHAVQKSVAVVRAVHDLAGGSSVYKTSPIQRRLRDSETITQHMMTNQASYELVGRVRLGGYEAGMLL